MDNSYNKEEDEDEGTTLDSEPPTPEPHNTGQLSDSDNETDTI